MNAIIVSSILQVVADLLCSYQALMKHATDAMKEARMHDFLASVDFEIH